MYEQLSGFVARTATGFNFFALPKKASSAKSPRVPELPARFTSYLIVYISSYSCRNKGNCDLWNKICAFCYTHYTSVYKIL